MFTKVLNLTIKIAGVIVTAPVTWLVAGQLFFDVSPLLIRYAVQLAAVLLVEGVLIANWSALETDKNAPPEIKTRYALTALALYIGLWLLAIQHGEGIAGIVFRLALGAALLGSGWDSYVTTFQKLTARTDKDIAAHPAVRKHWRKLAIVDAKAAVSVQFDLSRQRREIAALVEGTALDNQKQQQLAAVKRDHKTEMASLSVQEPAKGTYPYPIKQARKQKATKQQDSREVKISNLLAILRDNSDLSLRQLGQQVGASHETVSRYLNELENDGMIRRSPDGIEVLIVTGNGQPPK